MAKVEVYNGDLEGALAVFKQKVKAEGIVKEKSRGLYRGNRKQNGAKKK